MIFWGLVGCSECGKKMLLMGKAERTGARGLRINRKAMVVQTCSRMGRCCQCAHPDESSLDETGKISRSCSKA